MSTAPLPLFPPSSIAIIGASSDKAKFSTRVVDALRALEYPGTLYFVNTNTKAVPGEQVYKETSDIPGKAALAVLFVPARVGPSAIEDCARKGVKVAIVHGAGFAELGEEGRVLQEAMTQAARASGLRIVGPNCMGIASPSSHINMVTTRYPVLEPGVLGFAGQSGWATEYALTNGTDRGLGFTAAVSYGNQADLSIADYLDYFGSDPETKIIGAYVEGFKDGPRFIEAARPAASRQPVVNGKRGRTSSGARFTPSHHGSLAGGVAACDTCEAVGLEIPQLPISVQQELRDYLMKILPPFAGISNPVDLVWAPPGMEETIYGRSMEIMSPWGDAFLVAYYPPQNQEGLARWLAEMRDRLQKPILSVPPYGHVMQPFMRLCTKFGVPSFDSVERAVRALQRLVRRAEWLRQVAV